MSDRPRDTDPNREPDLERLADDLSATLADLRTEIEESRPQPRRGPLGFPRPPRPRELLEFADEFAIPTAIAVLEANIRALEALRAAIRIGRAGAAADERTREVRSRVEQTSQRTLAQLDDALADLEDALVGRPENREARTLFEDARTLRREIEDRLAASMDADGSLDREHGATGDHDVTPRRGGDDVEGDPPADPGSSGADAPDEGVTIDVDAELDSIRDEVGGGDAENGEVTGDGHTDDADGADNVDDADDADDADE